jgi:hypothetical protein
LLSIAGLGIEASTTAARGWRDLANGKLVAAAVAAGFTCILTRDGLFGESAARALKVYPSVAVVVVRLPQMRRHQFLDAFKASWAAAPITPTAGKLVEWP